MPKEKDEIIVDETKVEDTKDIETVEETEEFEVEETKDDTEEVVVEESLTEKYEKLLQDYNSQMEQMYNLTEQAKKAEQLSFNMRLQSEGLEAFATLFNTTDRNEQVDILKRAVDEILVANSYVPKDTAKQDEYQSKIKKGDVEGALASKLSRLFK